MANPSGRKHYYSFKRIEESNLFILNDPAGLSIVRVRGRQIEACKIVENTTSIGGHDQVIVSNNQEGLKVQIVSNDISSD